MQSKIATITTYVLYILVNSLGASNAYVCKTLCSKDKDYAEGVWQRIPSPAISTVDELAQFSGYKMGDYAHYCFKREVQGEFTRAREAILWKWKPKNCQLFDFRAGPIGDGFDVMDLLHKLSGKRLSLVGDSITEQQFISLRALLGDHVTTGHTDHVTVNGQPHHLGCMRFETVTAFKVVFCRNDHLVNVNSLEIEPPETKDGVTHDEYKLESTAHLQHSSPYAHLLAHERTILVMSTSSHWNDTYYKYNLTNAQYQTMTKNVLQYISANFKGEQVFINGYSKGHPDCERALGPYSDALYPHADTWYSWADFPTHNEIWKYAIKEHGDDRITYVDIIEMTSSRPDGHANPAGGDCLHYCQPGIQDYWNLLLSSFLMSCDSDTTASTTQ